MAVVVCWRVCSRVGQTASDLAVRFGLSMSPDGGPGCDSWACGLASLPNNRPIARARLASWEERIECAELHAAFAWETQQQQKLHGFPILPPCSWCGQPTGGYCEYCVGKREPVCHKCGAQGSFDDVCRACQKIFEDVRAEEKCATRQTGRSSRAPMR